MRVIELPGLSLKANTYREVTWRFGAEDGIRTRDPLLGKEMRYHCATSARRWTDENYIVSGASVPARLA